MQMKKEKRRNIYTGKKELASFSSIDIRDTRGHNTTSHRLPHTDCPYFHFYSLFSLDVSFMSLEMDSFMTPVTLSLVWIPTSIFQTWFPSSFSKSNTHTHTHFLIAPYIYPNPIWKLESPSQRRVMTQSAYTCSPDFMSFVFPLILLPTSYWWNSNNYVHLVIIVQKGHVTVPCYCFLIGRRRMRGEVEKEYK